MMSPDQLTSYTCQQLVELITDYLESALDPLERASFEAHLAFCTGCRNYLSQMQRTVDALEYAPPLPPAERAALLDLFRAWKNPGASAT
jgi:anti-sigma factor RsiW